MRGARQIGQGLLIGLWIVVSLGCQPTERGYHYFERLQAEEWSEGDEIFFSTSDQDSTQLYDVELVLRLQRSFHYSQLPIGITFETPTRHLTTRVAKVPIAHPQVRSGGFAIYEQSYPLEKGARYPERGVYTYSVRQLSTDSIIKGVVEVGLIITPRE